MRYAGGVLVLLALIVFNTCISTDLDKSNSTTCSDLDKSDSRLYSDFSKPKNAFIIDSLDIVNHKSNYTPEPVRRILMDQNTTLDDHSKKLRIKSNPIRKNSFIAINPQIDSFNVAYHCPEVMKEENTYEVSAIIKYLLNEKELINELVNTINESRIERGEEPITQKDIVSKQILINKYLNVKLIDPASKFKIVVSDNYPREDSIIKIYDDINQRYLNKAFIWKWLVTPTSNSEGNAYLSVIITPYDKHLKQLEGKERTFNIKITLKRNFFTNFWVHACRNPEWVLSSIITPVITFMVGLYFKRKKQQKPKVKE